MTSELNKVFQISSIRSSTASAYSTRIYCIFFLTECKSSVFISEIGLKFTVIPIMPSNYIHSVLISKSLFLSVLCAFIVRFGKRLHTSSEDQKPRLRSLSLILLTTGSLAGVSQDLVPPSCYLTKWPSIAILLNMVWPSSVTTYWNSIGLVFDVSGP